MRANSPSLLEVPCTRQPKVPPYIRVCRLTTGGSSPPGTYIIFSAYTITSDYLLSGQCITTTGSPIILPSPFSVAKSSATNSTLFQVAAESSFVHFLGFTTCSGGTENVPPTAHSPALMDTTVPTQITATLTSISNSTPQQLTTPPLTNSVSTSLTLSTPIHIPVPRPSQKDAKLAVGVAVPLGSVAISALAVLLWRSRRQRRHANSANPNSSDEDDSPAFLQRKAELAAEERRRYELQTKDTRHELKTRKSRSELNDEVRRQKLRGEEHSPELEATT